MLLILVIINLILSCIGLYSFINGLAPAINKTVVRITVIVAILVCITFLYYLMLVAGISFALLIGAWFVLNMLALFLKLKRKALVPVTFKFSSLYSLHTVIILGGILLMTIYFVMHASKYGSWDAWAIWNLHAKFLYAGTNWKNMFGTGLVYSHQDYPLMLPALVAFFWKAVGVVSPLIPLFISYLTMVAIPMVVYCSLADKLKPGIYSILALLIFVTDHNYQSIGAYQGADPLLSLLILLSFIWFKNISAEKPDEIYVAAFMCASCVWLKNEGILFYVVFSAGFLLTRIRRFGEIRRYAIGSIVPLAIAISFKLLYAPGNDLVTANHANTTQMLTNAGRYITLGRAILNMLVDNYTVILVLLLAAAFVSRKYFTSFTFIVIGVMVAGYIFIYLTTPYDLDWHLSTSLNRLFQHFYPAIIYSVLLSIKSSGKPDILNGNKIAGVQGK